MVDRIRVPLLIGQGTNDPRVPKAESDQIVAALRAAHKPVQYLLYRNEERRFSHPQNRLHFDGQAEEFLARCLGGRYQPVGEVRGTTAVSGA